MKIIVMVEAITIIIINTIIVKIINNRNIIPFFKISFRNLCFDIFYMCKYVMCYITVGAGTDYVGPWVRDWRGWI